MKLILITLVAVVVGLMIACEPEPTPTPRPTPTPAPVVVYNELQILRDGQSFNLGPIDAGKYRLELTATGNGVDVLWPASNCAGSAQETRSHTEVCTLKQSGQLAITNPSFLGTGPSSSVTIKLTYLPN
jgi:hypothetical protein